MGAARERFRRTAGAGGYNPCIVHRITVYGGKVAHDAIARAVAVLRSGGIVAFPTETVYGICVNAADPAAVNRLYAAKGRQASRACAFLLADRDSADALVPELPILAHRLTEAFWPGPLTLIVPHAGATVGLRLPAHGLARALAAEAGSPLLQSSANRSGEPAALNAAGVEAALGDSVDLLLDGGRGELNAVLQEFSEQGITPPPLCALAKHEGDHLFLPGQTAPLRPPRRSPGFRLLQFARDEAHRFAQHYHLLLRRKKTGLVNFYKPTRSRDSLVKAEMSSLIAQIFGGSIPALANSMLSLEGLGLEEIEKIKALIGEKEKELKGRSS